ncbi:30S ribosome-binding factor RbfA [Lignipirellula cremea]|uniref:Ribosome-binding factor A n=1 Tax=Lignipirellula cremea TaxID=2528010 RepID=A0A518DQW3_9BACT|nr:30S ribosome-binding factor RbfA [Lignipirellula cremea]QDU94230.1 Ribosome-binding factor A [Lignipirellula cremea]
MTSRRVLKAAAAIREVVSFAILTELRDPRVQYVTVTQVEVSPDMQQAKVYISVMGDEKTQQLTLHGLQSASGFLQSKISKRIDTRYTPRLKFLLDKGVKNSIAIAEILRQVLPGSGGKSSGDPADAADESQTEPPEAEASETEADDLDRSPASDDSADNPPASS